MQRYLQQIKKTDVTIIIDWLSVYYKSDNIFENLNNAGDTFKLSDNCYLLQLEIGTRHFKQRCTLFYNNNEVATVMFNPVSEVLFAKDIIKVDFKNETLYNKNYLFIDRELRCFGLIFYKFSRVDIAVDGCNYLINILNKYVKRNNNRLRQNNKFRLINSSEKRCSFSAKIYNQNKCTFENFNMGFLNSKKYITVYNKSSEIEKSGKTYILEYLHKNNILKIDPKIYSRKLHGDIYRFEMRLSSELINEIREITINKLSNSDFLASILQKHCTKYFQVVNVKTKKVYDLLPFCKFKTQKLQFIKTESKSGLYKAKLTIHSLINDIYNCSIKKENTNEVIEVIIDRVNKYRLEKYVFDKLDVWHSRYYLQTPKESINNVAIIIDNIKKRITETTEEVKQRATDNNQSFATASFSN